MYVYLFSAVFVSGAEFFSANCASMLGYPARSRLILHRRMSRKQRAVQVAELNALPPSAPRAQPSIGKPVGESFDHPAVDTVVRAMPVYWNGEPHQHPGCLHRGHASKTDMRMIDFVDTGHLALLRLWDKRQRGYRAMD